MVSTSGRKRSSCSRTSSSVAASPSAIVSTTVVAADTAFDVVAGGRNIFGTSDGFRFVYTLPLSPTELFFEDTYYSDGPALDDRGTDGVAPQARRRRMQAMGTLSRPVGLHLGAA